MNNFTPLKIPGSKKRNFNKFLIIGNLFLIVFVAFVGFFYYNKTLITSKGKASVTQNCQKNTGDCYVVTNIGVDESTKEICNAPHLTTCAAGYRCDATAKDCVPITRGNYPQCTWAQLNCPPGTVIDLTQPITTFVGAVSYCPNLGTAQKQTGCNHSIIATEDDGSETTICTARKITNYQCISTTTPTPTPTTELTITPTPTEIVTETPTPTTTPIISNTPTVTPTEMIIPSLTPTDTPTATPTETPGPTVTNTPGPSATPTEIIVAQISASPTTTVQLLQTGVIKSVLYWIPTIIILVGLIL